MQPCGSQQPLASHPNLNNRLQIELVEREKNADDAVQERDRYKHMYDVCGYYVETMCMEIERDVHMKWVYPWIHTSLFFG